MLIKFASEYGSLTFEESSKWASKNLIGFKGVDISTYVQNIRDLFFWAININGLNLGVSEAQKWLWENHASLKKIKIQTIKETYNWLVTFASKGQGLNMARPLILKWVVTYLIWFSDKDLEKFESRFSFWIVFLRKDTNLLDGKIRDIAFENAYREFDNK